jgi:hypothetical protein
VNGYEIKVNIVYLLVMSPKFLLSLVSLTKTKTEFKKGEYIALPISVYLASDELSGYGEADEDGNVYCW